MTDKTGPVNPFQADINARIAFLVALNKVQGLLEPAKKDSLNPHFKSKYASLSAVNETVMGPLSEAGFVLLSGGVDIGGKPHLRTTLYHIGGHSESFDYPLIEKTDNPQHIASSVTYARRYAICAMFNLSVEDDDANAATPAGIVKKESYVPSDAPARTAPAESQTAGELEYDTFVPSDVQFEEGKGKGAGKMFSKIFNGKIGYGGDETQGQMALSALQSKKSVTVGFVRNGRYLNIKRGCVKIVEPDVMEEVPF